MFCSGYPTLPARTGVSLKRLVNATSVAVTAMSSPPFRVYFPPQPTCSRCYSSTPFPCAFLALSPSYRVVNRGPSSLLAIMDPLPTAREAGTTSQVVVRVASAPCLPGATRLHPSATRRSWSPRSSPASLRRHRNPTESYCPFPASHARLCSS